MKDIEYTKADFAQQLSRYKKLIDDDIAEYCEHILADTREHFGDYPAQAVEAYCDLLHRGGKRIRGALVMSAYTMLGGTDTQLVLQAARTIEMLHAYILVIDDIQDRSETRRGGPTVHTQLKNYHEAHKLQGDSQHFGESIALNGALFGAHSAVNILTQLPVSEAVRLDIITNVNKHFISTAHGQTMDIMNEVLDDTDLESVDKVLVWKTAYYTFMNPMQLGAMLAGGTHADTEWIEKYALQAGRVFQITDDILGIFGTELVSGKNPMDDIREGKRTVLTVRALSLAPQKDAEYLKSMLGNSGITQTEFLRCRKIIQDSGALQAVELDAQKSVDSALEILHDTNKQWDQKQVAFLSELVTYLMDRKS